jgi:ABC-type phosphate/phosphonate transport system substrate-binding protein
MRFKRASILLLAICSCTAFLSLVWLAASAAAARAPAAAMNKTITISFIATDNAKNADGQTHA